MTDPCTRAGGPQGRPSVSPKTFISPPFTMSEPPKNSSGISLAISGRRHCIVAGVKAA